MRSLWRGSISFGLVHIPIRLYLATENRRPSFRLLHEACSTPVRNQRFCPTCERVVQDEDIKRHYEVSPGRFVPVEEEDLAALSPGMDKSVQILDFVKLEEIDPIYYEKSYFIEPAEGGARPYTLLVRAMEETGRTAIARFAFRQRVHLAAIRILDDGLLLLNTLHAPDEIRSHRSLLPALSFRQPLSEREIEIAVDLIDRMTVTFDPDQYRDEAREQLVERLRERAQAKAITAPAGADKPVTPPSDLLAALEESLRRTAEASGSPANR